MKYNVHSKHGMEQTNLAYYAECLQAYEEAEKAYDKNKKSVLRRKEWEYSFAQVEAIAELMDKLDIEYDEEEEG